MDSVSDVYEFVNLIIKKSNKKGFTKLATELENCMNLGSSGLEILGAIRKILCDKKEEIMNVLDMKDMKKITDTVSFVDKAYGI